jgi:hypothetical protein
VTPEELEITIEIVCTDLPGTQNSALMLGIQRDKAVIEVASAASKQIVFKPTLRARRNADGSVNFLGPFAQGPKAERFIYLNWTTTDKKAPTGSIGRIKLHLNHIKWAQVKKAAEGNKAIKVELVLTGAKGSPMMASVRPNEAKWKLS